MQAQTYNRYIPYLFLNNIGTGIGSGIVTGTVPTVLSTMSISPVFKRLKRLIYTIGTWYTSVHVR